VVFSLVCDITSTTPRHQNNSNLFGHIMLVELCYCSCYSLIFGPDSSVGIATDYGLDDPGSNPGWNEIFRPSRPALGPIQTPVKWVPGLSRG